MYEAIQSEIQRRRAALPHADTATGKIIVDLFAGGGGASEGMEAGSGRTVALAVNHNIDAVVMHAANHPDTIHLCEDVYKVHYGKVLRKHYPGRQVGTLWASPDCTHFSRAKGATPVKKEIRGLAFSIVRAVKQIKEETGSPPDVIYMENVAEMEDWGPLVHVTDANGRLQYTPNREPVWMPDKTKKGETFKRWVRELRALGGHVEWRQLNAADFGAGTKRKRLFLICRFDGKPVVWPKPTHGDVKMRLKNPKLLPYVPAADFINFNLPCPSIFLDQKGASELLRTSGIRCKRPLAPKTEWRIANGIKRFVIDADEPFIVQTGYGERPARGNKPGQAARNMPVTEPLNTIVGTGKHGLVAPAFTKFYSSGGQWIPPTDPMHTITGKDRVAFTPAYLVKANHGSNHMRGQKLDKPLHTITASRGSAVVQPELAAFVCNQNHGEVPCTSANAPLRTITTQQNKSNPVLAGLAPFISKMCQNGGNGSRNSGADEPLRTICSKNEDRLVTPVLSQFNGKSIGQRVDDAAPTIMGTDKLGLISPILQQVGHRDDLTPGMRADQPTPTILNKQHLHLTTAHIVKMRGDSTGSPATDPAPTITAGSGAKRPAGAAHAMGVVAAHVTQFFGKKPNGKQPTEPLPTVTAIDHNGLVAAHITQYYSGSPASRGKSPNDALPTITADDHNGLVSAHLIGAGGSGYAAKPRGADRPIGTIKPDNRSCVVAALLTKFYGTSRSGASLIESLPSVTADGQHLGNVHAYLELGVSEQALAGFWRVYAFLCKHLGAGAPLPLVTVKGQLYLIVDIGMRMLVPRELFGCQGFPRDYVLTGSQHAQVARCGNSVSPVIPKALIRANQPDLCITPRRRARSAADCRSAQSRIRRKVAA